MVQRQVRSLRLLARLLRPLRRGIRRHLPLRRALALAGVAALMAYFARHPASWHIKALLPVAVATPLVGYLSDVDDLEGLLAYGEASTRLWGLDQAMARCGALPPKRWHLCADGVSHGLPPALLADGQPDVALAKARIDGASARWQNELRDGYAQGWTEATRADVQIVLPALERLVEGTRDAPIGGFAAVDGVRVGLQQALGDDPAEAARVAMTWPVAWWPQLFEELGWRAGNELAQFPEAADALPPSARRAFASGMARGTVLRLSEGRDYRVNRSRARERVAALIAAHADLEPSFREGQRAAEQLRRFGHMDGTAWNEAW